MSSGADYNAQLSSLTEEFGRKLEEQRTRVRAAVDQQRDRLQALETALNERFQNVRDALEQAQGDYQSREANLASKHAEMKREEERLVIKNTELAKQRGQLEALVSHLEESQQSATTQQMGLLEEVSRQLTELRQRELQITKQKHELTVAQREIDTAKRIYEERERAVSDLEEELVAKENALREQEANLSEQQRELVARLERTKRQRVSLAKDIRKQRRDLATERELHRSRDSETKASDGDVALARELMAAREQIHELKSSLQANRGADAAEIEKLEHELRTREMDLIRQSDLLLMREQELKSKRSQLALELRAKRKELLAELEQKQAEIERIAYESKSSLAMRMAEAQAQCMVAQDQAEKERLAREACEEKLRIATQELEHYQHRIRELESLEVPVENGDNADEVIHLQQRLDMALADLRAERARNQELLSKPPRPAPVPVAAPTNAMDWEARKRSLLAQLEADYSDSNSADKAAKISLQDVIRQTNEVVSAKDAEIARLQSLLEEAAFVPEYDTKGMQELLDHDAVIREEREKLQMLQDQLREQFRQAEIDLSVERAKLARERLELEERLRSLPQPQTPPAVSPKDAKADPLKKQASLGGRWLARLGLSETDE
jgi:chromosome segregation ATPase